MAVHFWGEEIYRSNTPGIGTALDYPCHDFVGGTERKMIETNMLHPPYVDTDIEVVAISGFLDSLISCSSVMADIVLSSLFVAW